MRILCFGDSNTYGFDPRSYFGDRYPAEHRWVDILAQQTGWELINDGENGRTIPRNWDVLRLLSDKVPVDYLLVMLGTNDLLQGASVSETAARMEAFLIYILPHFKHIVLVAPPPMKRGAWVPTDPLVTASYRLTDAYKTLSQKLNIPFVDTANWNIALTFDGVHFTEDGHRSFAKHMADALRFIEM